MKNLEERLKEIEEHPQDHLHDFSDMFGCCMVNGSFDPLLMEAHSQALAKAGLKRHRDCDVISGHCGCGGVH